MATYNHTQLKNGLKLIIDNDPCTIVDADFVKPGKGQAFTRVRIRNLLNGRVIERTYKSGESVEGADVVDTSMQYLYTDGEKWHFMVPDTFEQHEVDKNAMGDAVNWVKEQDMCQVTLWNNRAISVTPPNPLLQVGPLPWDGVSPTPFPLTIPSLPSLAGANIFLQGLMFDPAPAATVLFALTSGIAATIGA